jgi:ABC-type amino acid transport substrate-binding protein
MAKIKGLRPDTRSFREEEKMKTTASLSVLLLIVLLGAGLAHGQEQKASDTKVLVGTKHSPPFAIKNDDGSWSGISIDLWGKIAREYDVDYELKEFDLEELLGAVGSGAVDVAIGALTMTPEREKVFNFTHPFYTTGLSIAVSSQGKKNWQKAVERFFSAQFLRVIAGLALLLLFIGFVAWLLERKRNPEQFGGSALQGIGSGFWWSAVTMTTVGYGDKAPATFLGRLLGMIWMFAGIIMISSFTAAMTSALTLTQLESKVSGPGDLPQVSVGSVPGSTSAMYLTDSGISFREYETPEDALRAVARGDLDAVVYDAPILRYLAIKEFSGSVQVLEKTFSRQDYAFALPPRSPHRETLNLAMLEVIGSDAWQDLLRTYLGE